MTISQMTVAIGRVHTREGAPRDLERLSGDHDAVVLTITQSHTCILRTGAEPDFRQLREHKPCTFCDNLAWLQAQWVSIMLLDSSATSCTCPPMSGTSVMMVTSRPCGLNYPKLWSWVVRYALPFKSPASAFDRRQVAFSGPNRAHLEH
jgi:hypothetical protein